MIAQFVKMHGTGNDFVVINEFVTLVPAEVKSRFAEEVCNRHFSIGADGVIFVCKPRVADADIRMRLFNADGSEGPMCGNGVRVLVKFAIENSLVPKTDCVSVETKAAIVRAYPKYSGNRVVKVRVDLGAPKIRLEEIPATGIGETMVNNKINVPGFGVFEITAVNTGSPHAVIIVSDVKTTNILGIGSAVRFLKAYFPLGTNVDFIEVTSETHLKVRTYERGVEAETLSCGTGIGASAVAAFLCGKILPNIPIQIEAAGGTLSAEVRSSNCTPDRVFIEGPAEYAFKGRIEFAAES